MALTMSVGAPVTEFVVGMLVRSNCTRLRVGGIRPETASTYPAPKFESGLLPAIWVSFVVITVTVWLVAGVPVADGGAVVPQGSRVFKVSVGRALLPLVSSVVALLLT